MKYDFDIVTLHKAQNFGAALQAYALQTHLERLGYRAGIYDAEQVPAPTNRSLRGLIISSVVVFTKVIHRKQNKEVALKFFVFSNENFNLN